MIYNRHMNVLILWGRLFFENFQKTIDKHIGCRYNENIKYIGSRYIDFRYNGKRKVVRNYL